MVGAMACSEMASDLVADRAELADGPVVAAVSGSRRGWSAPRSGRSGRPGRVRRRRRSWRAGRWSRRFSARGWPGCRSR